MSIYIASLVKIPCYLLKLSSGNINMGVSRADNSIKISQNLPISNPNQISTISIHIPSVVKIHWCLLKLSSGNEKRMEGRTDRHRDVQRETIIHPHYCVVGYKKWRLWLDIAFCSVWSRSALFANYPFADFPTTMGSLLIIKLPKILNKYIYATFFYLSENC